MSLLLTGRQWSSQFDRGPEPANDVVSGLHLSHNAPYVTSVTPGDTILTNRPLRVGVVNRP